MGFIKKKTHADFFGVGKIPTTLRRTQRERNKTNAFRSVQKHDNRWYIFPTKKHTQSHVDSDKRLINNQIDHMLIEGRQLSNLLDVQARDTITS